jgi:hypothetical protein
MAIAGLVMGYTALQLTIVEPCTETETDEVVMTARWAGRGRRRTMAAYDGRIRWPQWRGLGVLTDRK